MSSLPRPPTASIGALAIALAAGSLCALLRVPLPWMIGPMLAVAAARIGGWHLVGPRGGRQTGQWMAQSLRILMVVVIVPSVFAVLRLHGADPFVAGVTDVRWPVLLTLLGGTAIAGLGLQRVGVPNAFVLGALAVVIPLTASGVDSSAMPRWMLNGAQLLLGCALGSRFNRGFIARAPRFVGAVVVTVALALLLSAAFAAVLAWASGIHPATLVLATAPGGIAEMAITAKVLELGVPVVTAFHVARVILLLTCTGPLFGWLRRRQRAPAGGPVA